MTNKPLIQFLIKDYFVTNLDDFIRITITNLQSVGPQLHQMVTRHVTGPCQFLRRFLLHRNSSTLFEVSNEVYNGKRIFLGSGVSRLFPCPPPPVESASASYIRKIKLIVINIIMFEGVEYV